MSKFIQTTALALANPSGFAWPWVVESCQDDGDTGLALAAFRGHLDASLSTEQGDGEGSLKGCQQWDGTRHATFLEEEIAKGMMNDGIYEIKMEKCSTCGTQLKR